jgi:hypothetical protein
MTMQNPFAPDTGIQKPGIIGARWWNHRLDEGANLHGRRAALIAALVVGSGVAVLGGLAIVGAAVSSGDDAKAEWKSSLEVQRDYGWNFGAPSETVAFDLAFTQAYAREALKTLEKDLAPTNPAHQAFYVPSLFQSPEALPRLTMEGQTERIQPLAEALRPIRTPEMLRVFAVGQSYAELVTALPKRVMTVVDLDGPAAVAFAAGAADRLDPVFLFDNWPHPKGVVPAHLTLAAATYHQPTFQKAAASRSKSAPPLFVLDRARLRSYTDDATQFDNRYLAKLPGSLGPLGAELLFLVVGNQTSDLPVSLDLATGLRALGDPRVLAADAFRAGPGGGAFLFGGSPELHATFASRYGMRGSSLPSVRDNDLAERYEMPDRGPSVLPTGEAPGIGYVPVVVALGTGLVVGSRFNRSGSWNRAYSDDGYSSSGG